MRLRTAALLLLLVTVLAPIVLYTDILATYLMSSSASSGNNFTIEEAYTFTFGGDIRPLNILPHESTTILKEQLGIVYSECSTQSLANVSDASANDNTRKTRQLTEDSVEHQPTLLSTLSSGAGDSQTVNENPIRQRDRGLSSPYTGTKLVELSLCSNKQWSSTLPEALAEVVQENNWMSTLMSRKNNSSARCSCLPT